MSTLYRGFAINEVLRGAPQAGMWMVYYKHSDRWITASGPVPRPVAVERVKELRDDPNVSEPHCVPL